ncbi:hypothetical protein TNCV_4581611 [Trichonephila clavipes]|nr:hypothetical protein TNCV_4581611 [Trichonephila clavipes]
MLRNWTAFGDYTFSGFERKALPRTTIIVPLTDKTWLVYSSSMLICYIGFTKNLKLRQVIRSNILRLLGHIWRSPENNFASSHLRIPWDLDQW